MVYGARRPGGRSPWTKSFRKQGSVKRYAAMAKPTADNQKKQIVALAGQVGHLQSQVRIGRQISQYQYTQSGNVGADYAVADLVVPTAWGNVFADPPAIEDANRINIKHLKVDMQFTSNTEPNMINFAVFLVTLKPETADQLLSVAGSGLTALVDGNHYCNTGAYSGLVLLNEQFFSIKKEWRFTTTEVMAGATQDPGKQQSQSYKRIHFKMPFQRRLWSGRNSWRTALTSDRVASQAKLYLLMFNDNSILDAKHPAVDINAVFKVEGF